MKQLFSVISRKLNCHNTTQYTDKRHSTFFLSITSWMAKSWRLESTSLVSKIVTGPMGEGTMSFKTHNKMLATGEWSSHFCILPLPFLCVCVCVCVCARVLCCVVLCVVCARVCDHMCGTSVLRQ